MTDYLRLKGPSGPDGEDKPEVTREDYVFEDHEGNKLYPVTDSSLVSHGEGDNVANTLEVLRDRFGTFVKTVDANKSMDELSAEIKEAIKLHDFEKIGDSTGVHGVRIKDTGNVEVNIGGQWKSALPPISYYRDNSASPLIVQASATPPPIEDARIYYNTSDKNFYIGKDGQWRNIFTQGGDKISQKAPLTPPKAVSVYHDGVSLMGGSPTDKTEFRVIGFPWQKGNNIYGLKPVTTYKAEYRFEETEVYAASPPSPQLTFKTEKAPQTPPGMAIIKNIGATRFDASSTAGSEIGVFEGSNQVGTWKKSPASFTGLKPSTTYTVKARMPETDTHKESNAPGKTVTTLKPDDMSGSPGPKELQAGTMQEGFFGFVSASDFINGRDLANKCGITEGDLQNNDIRWLKFAWKGKILFRPQKTIRHSISWNHIDSKGCVYGKNISFGGNTYKVRLMRGALTDPSKSSDSDRGAHGSEYNRLVLPLHEQAKTGNWDYKDYVESNLPNWGVGLTNADFGTASGTSGFRAWSMEKTNESGDYRVYRGNYGGASYSLSYSPGGTHSNYGWAPVLEVVL